MAKKASPKQVTPNAKVSVAIHADIQNVTAFQLGFHHGANGVKARKRASFIYQQTAADYTLGFMAGCAKRALTKAARV